MKSQRLVESLSEGILATIRADDLAPGQALPSARELASRFGVTVLSIREALRRLEAVDVVELRHGSGTYVGSSIDRRVLDNPYYTPEGTDATREFYDARIALEPGIAALAAHQRDEEALRTLGGALDDGVGFHVEMARASRNRALREHLEVLLAVNVRAHHSASEFDAGSRCHGEHLSIVDAVRAGDPGQAGQAMTKHLVNLKSTALGVEGDDNRAGDDRSSVDH